MQSRSLERIKEVAPEEMALILQKMKDCGLRMIRYGADTKYFSKQHAVRSSEYSSLSSCFLISETLTKIELTTTYYTNTEQPTMKPTTWVCSLNEEKISTLNGQKAYMQFQRAAKIPTAKMLGIENELSLSNVTGKFNYSAVPMIGSKSYFKAVFSNVYEYDINSAYASVLLRGVPNFADLRHNGIVGHNEIGWILTENLNLVHEGGKADFIAPIIDTPVAIVNYIEKWYKLKKEGNKEAKCMLNFPIGYYQRTNPLFRAYVVNSCNELISSIMNDNVIMWNTDAVYSLMPLKLEIGDNIGQWKLRKIKQITICGCNYQIENETPVYRGVPKHWFEAFERINRRPFDMNRDTLPERVNKWFMNWKTLTLEVIQ